jgi:hypothetical protein
MINKAVNEIVNSIILYLTANGWGGACNGLGVQLLNGKVVNKEQQNSPDYNYIGIDDRKGTYCYIRENSNTIALTNTNLGACGIGQSVSVQLRAVGVSNNPKNTAQIMADSLYSLLYNANPNVLTNVNLINDISINPAAISTDYADIYEAETGAIPHGNLQLCAVDFELSFDLIGCALPDVKLC